MPDLTPQALRNHPAISMTTIHSWPSIFLGLPFMGMGIFIVLLSLGVIPCPDEKFHAPREIVASFGGFFFLAGLFLGVNGFSDLIRESRVKDLQSQRPGDRSYFDYRWNKSGIKDNGCRQLAMNFIGIFLIYCIYLLLR